MEIPTKPGSLKEFTGNNPEAGIGDYSQSISTYRKGVAELLGVSVDEVHSMSSEHIASEIDYYRGFQDERTA